MAPKAKSSGKVEEKSSGKPSKKSLDKPTPKPSGKVEEKPPETPSVISMGVLFFWIIIVVLIAASSVAIFMLLPKEKKPVKKEVDPFEEPFKKLRELLAVRLNRPDLRKATATVLDDLPDQLEDADREYEVKKKKYRDIFLKMKRSSLGPWKLYERSLYYFSKEKKTWYDAENFCVSRDAHLASILDEEEQNFTSSQLQQPSWIGLVAENNDGQWRWSDGSRLEKEYWSEKISGESSQDCTLMVPSLTAYNWNDENCYKLYRWICKEDLDHGGP